MKHYGVSPLVDFARGILAEPEAEALRTHLAGGCSECGDLVEFGGSLSGICGQMAANPVPEWVVRRARAIFPGRSTAEPTRAKRLPVELIYDSLISPEPAGLRANWQMGWQALYRAGDCSLDLRVEPELASNRASVVGQLSDCAAPERTMVDIPVFLKSGQSVVAETRSNRFGEFQMEYEQHGRLQLCVYLENGTKRFQVPLKKSEK
jgi:hypothetical protein